MKRIELYRQPPILCHRGYELAAHRDDIKNLVKITRQEDLLRVDVYSKNDLVKMKWILPVFTTWISLKEMEYRSYNYRRDKESKACLENCNEFHWFFWDECTYYDQKSKHEAIRFFRKEPYCCAEPMKMITKCQKLIQEERILREKREELNRVEKLMSIVPQYPPKGFKAFAKYAVQPLMFYDPKKMWCSFCEKELPRREHGKPRFAKHNMTGICPECKNMVTYKSWNKQAYLEENGTASCIQKAGDTKVYRQFAVDATYKKDALGRWTVSYTMREFHRVMLNTDIRYRLEYVSTTRFKKWREQKFDIRCEDVIFRGNLNRVFADEPLGQTRWQQFLPDLIPSEHDYNISKIKTLRYYPYMEYIERAGLTRLRAQLMSGVKPHGLKRTGYTGLADALGVTGQQLARMKKLNLGLEGRMWLLLGEKISDELLQWCSSSGIYPERCMFIGGIPPQKIAALIKKTSCDIAQVHILSRISKYRDYIDMARRLDMDVTDEIVWNNKRWEHYHDSYLEELNRLKEENRDKSVNEKFIRINRDYKLNSRHFKAKKDNLMIVVPKRASDITKEGRLQHHCVGASDTYLRKMDERKTFIIFLRKTEAVDEPFYTIEIDWQGKILQYYGAYDRKPEQEMVDKWLKAYKKIIKKRGEKDEQPA